MEDGECDGGVVVEGVEDGDDVVPTCGGLDGVGVIVDVNVTAVVGADAGVGIGDVAIPEGCCWTDCDDNAFVVDSLLRFWSSRCICFR